MKTEMDFLTNSSVLLDACFLLDSNSKPSTFGEFVKELNDLNVSIVAIDFVKTEFVRTQSKRDYLAKLEYFNKVVEAVLPVDKTTESLIPGLINEYGKYLTGVSSVDLYLAATLKRYRGLYLFTANHRDFPLTVFDRFYPVNFQLTNAIKTYAFYRYKSGDKKIEVETEEMPL